MNEAGSAGLPLLVAVTGASGACYADAFLRRLRELGIPVHLVLSEPARAVCAHEGFPDLASLADELFRNDDLFAPCASGTTRYRAMAVVPCSMGTLGRIAHGVSDSLIARAADVFLKERRAPLVEIVYAQCFANAMALSLGHAPGVFRQSSKITTAQ